MVEVMSEKKRHRRRDKDERTGEGWADGKRLGSGNAGDSEGEGMTVRAKRASMRERVVVEERGSVVERPSRCGHELRRSGNVGSV